MLFIDSLADFLASTESKSSEEVREELIVEGIDPDISTNRLIEYAHKCSMDAKLKSRNGLHGPLIRVYADRDQALLASQSLSGPFAPPAEATDAH